MVFSANSFEKMRVLGGAWRGNNRCFSNSKSHLLIHTLQELNDRLWIKNIFLRSFLLWLVLAFIQNLTSKHAIFSPESVVATFSNN